MPCRRARASSTPRTATDADNVPLGALQNPRNEYDDPMRVAHHGARPKSRVWPVVGATRDNGASTQSTLAPYSVNDHRARLNHSAIRPSKIVDLGVDRRLVEQSDHLANQVTTLVAQDLFENFARVKIMVDHRNIHFVSGWIKNYASGPSFSRTFVMTPLQETSTDTRRNQPGPARSRRETSAAMSAPQMSVWLI